MQKHVTADSRVISVINSAAFLITTSAITDILSTEMLVAQQDAATGTEFTTTDTVDINPDVT